MRRVGIAVVGVVVMGLASTVLAEVDLGAMKEAQEDLDGGRLADCMSKLGKLLAHTSGFEKTTERGKLMAMKGECLLQQKQGPAALEAFTTSAAAYPAKDAKDAAVSSATAELIGKSKDLIYVPTTGEKKGIGIVDPKTRTAAFAAMFADALAEKREEMKTVLKGTPQLTAIEDFAGKVREVSNVEIAATGDEKQTRDLMKEVAAAAKKNFDATLAQMNKQADGISTDAAKMVTVGKGQRARGITPTEKNTLNAMIQSTVKLTASMKSLTGTLETDADYFKQESDDAAALKAKAEDVLKKNKVNG